MQQAVLEAEPVDERFERGAGRAQRQRHVDLAGTALVEIIGRGHARAHLAAFIVHRQDGDRNLRPERVRPLVRQILQGLLQAGVDGEPVNAAIGLRSDHLVGGMRRQHRQRLALARHACRFRARDLVARHHAGRRRAVEHAVARRLRGIRKAIRPAQFRRLRQRDQQCRFRQRKLARLLAEIGERGGADAFQVAAIGCQRQVKRKNLVLAERLFELERARDLAQLGAEAAMLARLQQPRHLHGDGRTAGDDVAVAGELECGTAERQQIDAMMLGKAFVLIGKQQLQKARIDVFLGRRQPPAPLAGGIGAQQLPLTVEHHVRCFEILAERRRPQRIHPRSPGQRGQQSRTGKARQGEPPRFHFAAVMSIVPVAVRPKRSGRYMSSTTACGST